jgi:uncharacterized membrane protein
MSKLLWTAAPLVVAYLVLPNILSRPRYFAVALVVVFANTVGYCEGRFTDHDYRWPRRTGNDG